VKKIRSLQGRNSYERLLAHFGGWRAVNVTATEIVKYVAKRQGELVDRTSSRRRPGCSIGS
jgi:hypothetical protein